MPIMIALGTPQTARLQAQVGEGLATVASCDFPERWEKLVDVSAGPPTSYALGGDADEDRSWYPPCRRTTSSLITECSRLLIPSSAGESSVRLTPSAAHWRQVAISIPLRPAVL